jgi:hypothetical protein
MAKPPPPPRKTMEVDISGLDDELKKNEKKTAPQTAGRPSGKKPPRMPGAAVTMPPLPVTTTSEPPRRNTIDVQMEWVELVDDNGNVVKKLTEKK